VAFLHEMLGLEHLCFRDFDAAIAQLTKAIALQPESAIAYNLRGASLSDQGARLEDAIGDLDRAIELDPSVALAWSNRAKTRRRQRRFDDAMHDIDYALWLAPGADDSVLFRMGVLLDLERHADLIAAADDFLSRKASPFALINRGAAKLHLGDLDGALADLDAGLALSPLEDGFFFRGRVHLARLALDAAERDFKILLDNGVDEPRRSECVDFLAEIQTARDERPWWKKLFS
jgi:tetratricopeptide (TPR) repeat protein